MRNVPAVARYLATRRSAGGNCPTCQALAKSTVSVASWRLRRRGAALQLMATVAGAGCAAACVVRGTCAAPAASDCTPMAPALQFQLVDSLDPSALDQAAELLATQWPARGPSYRRQLLQPYRTSACRADRSALPKVLLLIDREASNTVVAHCKLQVFPQADCAGDRIAVLVSCVVHTHYRNRGLGRLLVSHAEQAAAANGHGELFLWTLPEDGVAAFYKSCGFEECQRPSYSPAHGRRLRAGQRNCPPAPTRAVWMRKPVRSLHS